MDGSRASAKAGRRRVEAKDAASSGDGATAEGRAPADRPAMGAGERRRLAARVADLAGRLAARNETDAADLRESITRLGREVVLLYAAAKAAGGRPGAPDEDVGKPQGR